MPNFYKTSYPTFPNFGHFVPFSVLRGVIWNDSKSTWKMILSCDGLYPFIWNDPKSGNFILGRFFVLKLIMCELFEMPHFSMFQIFEIPYFSYLILKSRKRTENEILRFWGISNKFANAITCIWSISYDILVYNVILILWYLSYIIFIWIWVVHEPDVYFNVEHGNTLLLRFYLE